MVIPIKCFIWLLADMDLHESWVHTKWHRIQFNMTGIILAKGSVGVRGS